MEYLEQADPDRTDTAAAMSRTHLILSILLGFAGKALMAQQLQPLAPATFVPGTVFPLAVEARDNGAIDLFHSEQITLSISGGTMDNSLIEIKKARGMARIVAGSDDTLRITGQGMALSLAPNPDQPILHSGTIAESEIWPSGTVHHIISELAVDAGDTLTIESGCWVLLDSAVNITVDGNLAVHGTSQEPVVFVQSDTAFGWGGIIADAGTVNLNYALLTGGGADQAHAYLHSNSQATVKSNGGTVTLDRCFIFDCPGKGIGAEDGVFTFSDGAISRCDMGGEFASSHVRVRGSHILDIPNDDGLFQDDDNDGLYISGVHATITDASMIDSCVFIAGKDDGIDHNGAVLEVHSSWIEGFEHEGVAASNSNSVLVYNTLVKDCEQGIEAGYGSPSVTVDHCLLMGNDYGLRFGDWYDWGCSGSVVCTNSIMHLNGDNIHNFDVLTNGPIAGAMDVTYSMTNDSEYDSGDGCLSGSPSLSSAYLLQNGSPGIGAGNDGLDMGLIAPLATSMADELGNMPSGRPGSIRVFDLQGRMVMNVEGHSPSYPDLPGNRMYIVVSQYGNSVVAHKQVMVK